LPTGVGGGYIGGVTNLTPNLNQPEANMKNSLNRRAFVKGTVLGAAGLAMSIDSGAVARSDSLVAPSDGQATMPVGRIGDLAISRLILGGNLLTHYTHSRDLQYVYRLAARYNTDEKILDTLALAEAHGVNTLTMHNPPHPMSVLRRYRKERGGKIQWIICPTAPIRPGLVEYRQQVEQLMRDGCESIYVWGVHGDALARGAQVELLGQAVELAKRYGVPSGVGAHALEVIELCEEHKLGADFYIKTFHHHSYPTGPKPDQIQGPYNEFPGYWCDDPKKTAEFMQSVKKPWIAFKVMAAGAIPPRNAFRYAFRSGADFVLAGMFDFEIEEDAAIARECVAALEQRDRPWMA